MNTLDRHHKFEEQVFSYRETKDKVFIYWHGRQITILKGKQARKFLAKMEGLDHQKAQLAMAKITGNFKRGNERRDTQ